MRDKHPVYATLQPLNTTLNQVIISLLFVQLSSITKPPPLVFLLAGIIYGNLLIRTVWYHMSIFPNIFIRAVLQFFINPLRNRNTCSWNRAKYSLTCFVQWMGGGENRFFFYWTYWGRSTDSEMCVMSVLTCLLWQITSELARQSHQLSAVFARPLPPDYTRDVSLPPPVAVSSAAAHLQAPHSLPPFTARWVKRKFFSLCLYKIYKLTLNTYILLSLPSSLDIVTLSLSQSSLFSMIADIVAINTINATLTPQPLT